MLFYRFLVTLVAPLILLRFEVRRLSGKTSRAALAERMGGDGQARVSRGAVLWFHGASLGELAALRPIIVEALERDPRLEVIVTCNSETGRATAPGWGLERLHVSLAPFDQRLCLARFIGTWQPSALITVENEIWPNRFALCAARGIPVLLIGARMSEKSARLWRVLGGGLRRRVFGAIRYLAAQDPASEARFRALGVASPSIGPLILLKGDAALPPADPSALAGLQAVFDRANTVLAASTHEGEEAAVLRGFKQARAALPALRLILAPRHPERGDAVAELIRDAGLGFARRSKGEAPGDAEVYLADTLGEMALWFQLAGTTFMGGSLVPKGGHTPFEPAQFDTAILHGPSTQNNAAAYEALAAQKGALTITSAEDLAHTLRTLATDEDRRHAMARNAHLALAALRRDDAGKAALWRGLAKLTANDALDPRKA